MDSELHKELVESWKRFLSLLGEIGTKVQDERKSDLKMLLGDLIGALLSDDYVSAMAEGFTELDDTSGNFFKLEIDYFVNRYSVEIKQEEFNADEALEDGEVVKGSAESLITKLWKPLQRLIAILDEVLKLLMGGAAVAAGL